MAVHAHPDDESVSTGGVLARYSAAGHQTILVVATRGEEGEIHDPDLDPAEAKPRLGEIRTAETMCAARALGLGAVEFLGYRDSGMAGTPENANPASFHQASVNEAADRLMGLIRRYRPHVLITYNAFGGYGHPDHQKAHQITHLAFQRAGDSAYLPSPDLAPWQPQKLYHSEITREEITLWKEGAQRERERRKAAGEDTSPWNEGFFEEIWKHSRSLAEITAAVDVGAFREQKIAALRCHRTQFAPDNAWFEERNQEPPELANFEHFFRAESLVAASERESDLFEGI
jgi:LmbE family N-acetylglucosaminyl deacetylase